MIRHYLLLVFVTLIGYTASADTIDVWTVRRNGKPFINSNANDIPMNVDLSKLSINDTLEVGFWTDCGMHNFPWRFSMWDGKWNFLAEYHNRELTLHSMEHESFINFQVKDLWEIMQKQRIDKLSLTHKYDDEKSAEDDHIIVCNFLNKPRDYKGSVLPAHSTPDNNILYMAMLGLIPVTFLAIWLTSSKQKFIAN